ncbi:hypothetical protein DFH11DRAFT_1638040 [Phellopilus nigrolimitatus]|nr:hypothetical protein DFH11DRAFT_1638040 [Phellopilus nigrolimitatus]
MICSKVGSTCAPRPEQTRAKHGWEKARRRELIWRYAQAAARVCAKTRASMPVPASGNGPMREGASTNSYERGDPPGVSSVRAFLAFVSSMPGLRGWLARAFLRLVNMFPLFRLARPADRPTASQPSARRAELERGRLAGRNTRGCVISLETAALQCPSLCAVFSLLAGDTVSSALLGREQEEKNAGSDHAKAGARCRWRARIRTYILKSDARFSSLKQSTSFRSSGACSPIPGSASSLKTERIWIARARKLSCP